MAGTLYLGRNKVCPAILVGGGYPEFASYEVNDGVASKRSGELKGDEFKDITSIADSCWYYKFYNCSDMTGTVNLSNLKSIGSSGLDHCFFGSGITGVDFSSLDTLGSGALSYSFSNCNSLTSVSFSALKSLDSGRMNYAFTQCTGLLTVDFPALETISGGFYMTFQYCHNLQTATFPKLSMINGQSFYLAFGVCEKMTSVYFNSLTTQSFSDSYALARLFSNATASDVDTLTVHFPSNIESVVSTLAGYPNFGGPSNKVVLAFDLPATS